MNSDLITLQHIIQAHGRIKPYIRHTPLEYNGELSRLYDSDIYLKLEDLQVTGSFKARGAFNKLLTLQKNQCELGVIAPSAGNHGIGLAYAAHKLNVPAFVYLPFDVDESKVKALESYGAVITYFDSIEEARVSALRAAEETGYTFLSAYNNRSMIEAGGTIGLEILEDLTDVDTVITCLGGGGLTAGLCIALKSINPNIKVWGVQTKNSPTFAVWHQNGEVCPVDLQPSIAEGLSGPIEPETLTFPIIHEHIDRILTVTDEDIIEAMKSMLKHQYIVEPSGAAGIAALRQLGVEIKGRKIAVVVTGRNISWSRFLNLVK
ncbi:threonine/serine dehydratase [Bacillus salipaludis]|uniref:threonine ammonia-lyase n=1 Tax=Bacillus salipaludis TaxID=2547811 RepID=A0A4V3ATH6_9BACI|nr:threonine/serine dehydratase [Bacillus salipaludis]TDK59896.1 threonine/serine dehydratase [Bacillus salipaludis]